MTRLRGILEFGAGAAIGLLVGLIAGISISPVTSTILGALSTGLLVLLGFKESKEEMNSKNSALRVLGFGLFCSVSLIIGISLRTHQALSPSLATQKQRLTDVAVFTPSEIEHILLSTNFGLQPSMQPDSKDPANPGSRGAPPQGNANKTAGGDQAKVKGQSADLAYAGLLRAGSAELCQLARRENFRDLHAYMTELKNVDPKLAHVIESATESDQDRLSKSLSAYLCP